MTVIYRTYLKDTQVEIIVKFTSVVNEVKRCGRKIDVFVTVCLTRCLKKTQKLFNNAFV